MKSKRHAPASHNNGSITNLLYCLKLVTIHGWLCNVIHCLRPFSVVNNNDVRAHIKYDRMSLNPLKNCLVAWTTCAEHSISFALLDPFVLVCDGQTTIEGHYSAMFAINPSKNAVGYCAACLATSLLYDEITQGEKNKCFFYCWSYLSSRSMFPTR